jgi:hypothetical protein
MKKKRLMRRKTAMNTAMISLWDGDKTKITASR